MAEYIEREALIARLKFKRDNEVFPQRKYAGLECAIAQVQKIPTADVVEVVRCKDCKRCYEKRTKRNKQLMRFCMRMDGNEYQVNANDFCSYGKRKGEGDV